MYKAVPIPTRVTPKNALAIPGRSSVCIGKLSIPKSMAIAIRNILAKVPRPGLTFNGIQMSITKALIRRVDTPNEIDARSDTPSAKIVHGALPRLDCTTRASPNPKRMSPKLRIRTLETERSQRWLALQGVKGTVL
jgi:hypothetical protein